MVITTEEIRLVKDHLIAHQINNKLICFNAVYIGQSLSIQPFQVEHLLQQDEVEPKDGGGRYKMPKDGWGRYDEMVC